MVAVQPAVQVLHLQIQISPFPAADFKIAGGNGGELTPYSSPASTAANIHLQEPVEGTYLYKNM